MRNSKENKDVTITGCGIYNLSAVTITNRMLVNEIWQHQIRSLAEVHFRVLLWRQLDKRMSIKIVLVVGGIYSATLDPETMLNIHSWPMVKEGYQSGDRQFLCTWGGRLLQRASIILVEMSHLIHLPGTTSCPQQQS